MLEHSKINIITQNAVVLALAAGAIAGSLAYYLWPVEPSLTLSLPLSIAALILWSLQKRFWPKVAAAFGGGAVLFFVWALFITQTTAPTFLAQKYDGNRYWLTGQVEDMVTTNKRAQVTLGKVKIFGVAAKDTPQKIKISAAASRFNDFQIGYWMATQAKLIANSPPAFEGDYDFRHYAFRNGVGARGIVMGEIYRTSGVELHDWQLKWLNLRRLAASKIAEYDNLGIATAMLTGVRSYIPKNVNEHFRASGLAHLLAISGLHMGLVGGLLFFAIRFSLSAIPYIAIKYNLKKIAAFLALIGSFLYMLMAGASIPTMRAFVMLGLLFVAVLLSRTRAGIRVLAVAVLVVLTLWPASVATASFQMSFVAAAALVFWALLYQPLPSSKLKIVKSIGYVQSVWACGLLAGLATMPIAALHFNLVSLSGFLLNVLAIPLMGFWVMPMGVLALAALPFGVEKWPLWLMQQGNDMLAKMADFGANGALGGIFIDQNWWLLLAIAALGLIVLFIMEQKRWFYLGFAGFLVLPFILPSSVPFNVVWLKNGNTVVVRNAENLYIAKGGDDYQTKAVISRLAKRYGLKIDNKNVANCDVTSCIYNGNIHIFNENYTPTAEDCNNAALIFADHAAQGCNVLFAPPKLVKSAYIKAGDQLEIKYFSPISTRVWQQ